MSRLSHLEFFLNHKFIAQCSTKVPSTLQYTAQTTKRRNVQNPDHSQLIQTQDKWEKEESRNKGAAFSRLQEEIRGDWETWQ